MAPTSVEQLVRNLRERAEQERQRAERERQRAEQEHQRAERASKKVAELEEKVEYQDRLIESLTARLRSLVQRLAKATDRSEQLALQFEMDALQRKVDELSQSVFGDSSERRRKDGKSKKDGDADGKHGGKGKGRKKNTSRGEQHGHGPTQQNLPRDEKKHELDEGDQVCPHCNPAQPLHPWEGHTQDSEEITVFERTFRIVVHKRQVYRCHRCGHLETAIGPRRLVPGGRYSPEFGVAVAVDKYEDHQPLDRQAKRMARQGLVVTKQTLWDQLQALYVLLLPSYLMLQKRILASDVVHADETHWRVMRKGGSKRWWVWTITDGQRVFFQLTPGRGKPFARELFQGYDGIVMSDRYSVYTALEKERERNGGQQKTLPSLNPGEPPPTPPPSPNYTLAACWMHARRGFIKAERAGVEAAARPLDLIAELYAIERRAKEQADAAGDDPVARQAALLEARRALRDAEAREVIRQLRRWLDTHAKTLDPSLQKAIRWVNGGWVHLTRFLDDPAIPLDNGSAERAIRGVVLGRKTHAGSRSEAGTRVAALFYSLVESCHLQGVSTRDYLNEAVRRALEDRETAFLPEDYAELLRRRAADAAATP